MYINDNNLYNAIESELNYLNLNLREVNETNMSKLKRVNLSYSKINNLSGIEYLVNAETINLSGNNISDLSPLLKLKKLQVLNLSQNENIDWSKLTSPLYTINFLILNNCNLKNDLMLIKFPNVQKLDLLGNEIKKIEALFKLKKLIEVEFLSNHLSQIEIDEFCNITGVSKMMEPELF